MDLDFPKLIHGPRRGLHVLVYSFAVCGLISCGKHRHAKRAGVIFSIYWVAWGKTGC